MNTQQQVIRSKKNSEENEKNNLKNELKLKNETLNKCQAELLKLESVNADLKSRFESVFSVLKKFYNFCLRY